MGSLMSAFQIKPKLLAVFLSESGIVKEILPSRVGSFFWGRTLKNWSILKITKAGVESWSVSGDSDIKEIQKEFDKFYKFSPLVIQHKYKTEHPNHSQEEWIDDVKNGLTLLGYWGWVCERLSDEMEINK